MAGIQCVTSNSADVEVGTAEEILLMIAPLDNNTRVKVTGYGVYFAGASVTNIPINVRFIALTAPGASSAAVVDVIGGTFLGTPQTAAKFGVSATPITSFTPGDVYHMAKVHPQAGLEIKLPLGQEWVCDGAAAAANYFGIAVTAPVAVNARGVIYFEE